MSDDAGPLCPGCQYQNPLGAPFCVRCSQALFAKKKKARPEKPAEPAGPTPVHPAWTFPSPAIPAHPQLKVRLSRGADALAIALLPLAAAPSKDQSAAIAAAIGIELYEARLRLSSRFPRLVRLGEPAALAPLADALAAAAVPFVFLPARALLPPIAPRSVARIEEDSRGLVLRCPTIAGETESLLLEPDRPCQLVYALAEEDRSAEPRIDHRRPSTGLFRGGPEQRKTSRVQRRHIFYLFIAASPKPVLFREDQIADFNFRGEAMAPSARENFVRLYEGLKARANTSSDESPKDDAGLVEQVTADIAVEADRYLEQVVEPRPEPDPKTGKPRVRPIDVLARLIFYRWWLGQKAA